MTGTHELTSPAPIQARPRKIVRRTRGSRHGPITRLMSPSDLDQALKPFIFLDLFDMESVEAGELAIFEPSNDAIDFHAEADTEFVLGSAAPHAHDLVLGQ